MRVSERGRAQIAAEEGVVLRAYKDVAGVWTIGVGHTAAAGGIRPRAGRVITRDEAMAQFADDLLRFEARVVAIGGLARQSAFDGAVSFDFNTGAIHRAAWVRHYQAGALDAAERALRRWTRAGGRHRAGLAARRAREADLIFRGRYAAARTPPPEGAPRQETAAPRRPDPVVEEAQEILVARGFDPGAIDGWMGARTRAAVLAYQQAHPHLTADGILGPATLAQLRRDALMLRDAARTSGAGGLAAGLGAALGGLSWGSIAALAVLIALIVVAWRFRDVIARRINTRLGRVVA